MGTRIIAGVIGFVVLVLLIQNYVLGDGDGPEAPGRTGAVPTATLPAQLPAPVSLGEVEAGGSSQGSPGTTTTTQTYVVQSGDTLGSIAASFNIAPEAQAAWVAQVLEVNGIADARLLQAGQELIVPGIPAAAGGTPQSSQGGIATATPGPGGAAGVGGAYIVESGDTPFGIAEKFCVEAPAAWVNQLISLNGIDPSAMTVGQELELPPGTPECE